MSALSLSTFRQRGDLIVSAVGELDVETAYEHVRVVDDLAGVIGPQPKVPR